MTTNPWLLAVILFITIGLVVWLVPRHIRRLPADKKQLAEFEIAVTDEFYHLQECTECRCQREGLNCNQGRQCPETK